jgi:polyisoprenoid-binding protein YceI
VQIKKAVLILVLIFVCYSRAVAADTYTIDPVHSSVGFSVQHMVISRVSGNFKEFNGTIVYDEKDPAQSSVNVHIKTASVDTRDEDRDRDVRGGEFFDVTKYPEIIFASTSIEKTEEGYVAHGKLTIRGVSRDVALPFKIAGTVKDPSGKTRLVAQAGLTINRKDFGVSWNMTLDGGGLVVGDEVKIDLQVEAVRQ